MRTFILKFCIFILLVIILQAITVNLTIIPGVEDDTPEQIAVLEDCVRRQPHIIYFGDSVLSVKSPSDKEKTIPDILRDLLPDSSLCSIAQGAYTADEFLLICKYFFRKKCYPKLIIIPVNLRSFSPSWHSRTGWQFEYLKAALASTMSSYLFHLFPRQFFTIVNFINPAITSEEFENTLVYDGEQPVGKMRDYDELKFRGYSIENMEKDIVCKYMYSLSDNQREVRYLINLVKLLKKENIRVIYYITPIDFESGVRYVGNRFIDRVNKNILILQKIFKDSNVEEPLNLAFALKADSFYWNLFLCEHLNDKGRAIVAQEITKIIKDSSNYLQ